jgi:hypothetical protein
MSITLPGELVDSVERARAAMLRDPASAVAPFFRSGIYQALRSSPGGARAHARLAWLTAQHVLPLWNSAWSDVPQTALALAHRVLAGEIQPELVKPDAIAAQDEFDRLGGTAEALRARRSFFAGQAAILALFEVLGEGPFAGLVLREEETDSDLDPWCSDAALWAAAALSGRVGESTAAIAQRREFWEWWLDGAIVSAWGWASESS